MTLRQWLLILLLSAIWGASFLFLRIAVPQAGVLLTTAARLGFASLLLGLVAWYFGHLRGWPLKRKMAILALVNSAIPFGLFSFAAQHLPAGYLAVLNASAPTQGLLIGVLLYKAPHHWKMWGGVVLGFAGVAFLTSMGPVQMGPMQWLGVLAGLGAAFCYAVTAYWTVNWFADMPSEKLAFQNQFMAFLWLVPALMAVPMPEIQDVGRIWMALLAAGILCTGVAYLLYFRILQEVGPVPSSSVGFLIPCFAMLWSFLFLNESINVAHLVGLGCIIWAVKWIQPVKSARLAPKAFWQGTNFETGLKKLIDADSSGFIVDAVRQSVLSVHMKGVGGSVPLNERLDRTLRLWLDNFQKRMDSGMTVLATITSAAPFVGLFGTVWGIYGALVGMGAGADAALLDKISGPIGEALIMTAVGLAVAIPSLVAYNMFARWTRLMRQDIEGFVVDIHAYAVHNAGQLATVEVK